VRSACLLSLSSALIVVGCSALDDGNPPDHHGDEPTGETSSALVDADPVSAAVTQSCSTAVVKGLATQLVDEIECLRPNTMTKISGLPGVSLATGAQAVPYLQKPAVDAMTAAQKARGVTLTINSGLRTLPQQYLLYRWYQTGRCGIGLAAKPGTSNHESAVAIDVADNAGWRTALTNKGFRWLGASDPVHYDYVGAGAVNLRGLSVKAFQRLWNRNHPDDKIGEDGAYGTETEKRLAKAPVGGFPKGALASCTDADAGVDAGSLEPADIEPVPDATEEDPKPEEPTTEEANEATGGGRLRSSGDSGGCNVSPSSTERGSLAVFGLALTIAFAAITRAALRRRT
jgi:LAS superfamily LD-carboxypeptidase LdcB